MRQPNPPAQPAADVAASELLDWYDRNRRDLPWRAEPGVSPDPYRVWLSEIMLQQTTVVAVAPFFLEFISRWPTVDALAGAPVDEVLSRWAGLGYYARARNLHACARAVVQDHGGSFPQTEEGLRQLPGIGPYTAAAVAAIAFNRPAAAVDGNVERVVTRLHAIQEPLPGARKEVGTLTLSLVPRHRPGDFAQAVMDLGATICTPKRPACALCPWMLGCVGRKLGIAELLPLKAARADRPTRRGAAFWAEREDGAVLIARRPDTGLLGGMAALWASPLTADVEPGAALEFAPFDADWRLIAGEVEHVFTHFRLRLGVFVASAVETEAPPGSRWVSRGDLGRIGLPTVMRKCAAAALRELHGPEADGLLGIRPPRRPRT